VVGLVRVEDVEVHSPGSLAKTVVRFVSARLLATSTGQLQTRRTLTFRKSVPCTAPSPFFVLPWRRRAAGPSRLERCYRFLGLPAARVDVV
jgi:hypothetical protein